MTFLSPQELETHLYKENIDVISREDATLLTAAIDAAIAEVKGYLASFDREKIFTANGDQRNALLLIFVKDIAVWHFVNLCNAGTDLTLRQDRYDRAISWLKAVQKGDVSPDLPSVDADNDGQPDTDSTYLFGSNPKRIQHF